MNIKRLGKALAGAFLATTLLAGCGGDPKAETPQQAAEWLKKDPQELVISDKLKAKYTEFKNDDLGKPVDSIMRNIQNQSLIAYKDGNLFVPSMPGTRRNLENFGILKLSLKDGNVEVAGYKEGEEFDNAEITGVTDKGILLHLEDAHQSETARYESYNFLMDKDMNIKEIGGNMAKDRFYVAPDGKHGLYQIHYTPDEKKMSTEESLKELWNEIKSLGFNGKRSLTGFWATEIDANGQLPTLKHDSYQPLVYGSHIVSTTVAPENESFYFLGRKELDENKQKEEMPLFAEYKYDGTQVRELKLPEEFKNARYPQVVPVYQYLLVRSLKTGICVYDKESGELLGKIEKLGNVELKLDKANDVSVFPIGGNAFGVCLATDEINKGNWTFGCKIFVVELPAVAK